MSSKKETAPGGQTQGEEENAVQCAKHYVSKKIISAIAVGKGYFVDLMS